MNTEENKKQEDINDDQLDNVAGGQRHFVNEKDDPYSRINR